MPDVNRLALVAAAVLVGAILVVELRHQSRTLFAQLQSLRAERDALNTEWGQLLLEEGTWSEHRRVEQFARARLEMSIPGRDRIVVIRSVEQIAPAKHLALPPGGGGMGRGGTP